MATGIVISICAVCSVVIAGVSFIVGAGNSESRKRGRVFARLDEHKEYSNITFVRKDVCAIINKQVSTDLMEIKKDIKKLLSKNGIK